MRNFFLGVFAFVSVVAMIGFLFFAIDIVDGRNAKMSLSPYFKASTDNAALALVMITMFASAFLALYFLIKMNSKPAAEQLPDIQEDQPEMSQLRVIQYADETFLFDRETSSVITHI